MKKQQKVGKSNYSNTCMKNVTPIFEMSELLFKIEHFFCRLLRTTSVFQAILFSGLLKMKMKFHVTTQNKHLKSAI